MSRWWLAALLVVSACKKEQAASPPASGSGSGSATAPAPAPMAVTPADAAEAAPPAPAPAPAPSTGMIELLHSTPATVRVSSRVANKKILPSHLVDHSTSTAWNSRTGDLAGAWIDVTIPAGKITELRLTVGHTGKGPHNEDYFTMNPRIRKVTVLDGKNQLASTTLDIEKRELQVVRLSSASSHVRLRIDDVAPGSKPSWRETCISELEAWGQLLPGNTATPTTPQVEVGEPPDDSWAHAPFGDDYCDKLLKPLKADYDKAIAQINAENAKCDPASPMPCGDPDPPGEPTCMVGLDKELKHPLWSGVGVMSSSADIVYGARPTQIVVKTKEGYWPVGDELDCGAFSDHGKCSIEITNAVVRKNGDLEIAYVIHYASGDTTGTLVCPNGDTVTCAPG